MTVPARRGRAGMTLLEMVFALSIATMAIVWTISSLFNAIAANRIMTANIAANAAILQQREEVMIVAHDGGQAARTDLVANVLEYYDELLAESNTVNLGPDGAAVRQVEIDPERGLVYRFPIPKPGEAVDPDNPYAMGYGEMVMYLRETAVPGSEGLEEFYEDLPYSPKTPVAANPGYDLNGDGRVRDFTFAQGGRLRKILRTPPGIDFVDSGTGSMWIQSLPVDINVYYYADAGHRRDYFETTRRILITGVTGKSDSSGE